MDFKFGVTALMKASVNGNMALVRALIGANADLNATEKVSSCFFAVVCVRT